MTYDMESFLDQCVEKYRDIAGKNVVFKSVATPSLPEDTKQHPARAPCAQGDSVTCPWCLCSFLDRGVSSPRQSAKGSSDTAGRSTEVRGGLSDTGLAPMDVGGIWQRKGMKGGRSKGPHWKGKGRGKYSLPH